MFRVQGSGFRIPLPRLLRYYSHAWRWVVEQAMSLTEERVGFADRSIYFRDTDSELRGTKTAYSHG